MKKYGRADDLSAPHLSNKGAVEAELARHFSTGTSGTVRADVPPAAAMPSKLNKLEVVVISLHPKNDYSHIRKFFPQTRVVQAVDLRDASPLLAVKKGWISDSTYDTISVQKQRRWDKEINSMGAVGIQQSNIKVLSMGEGPILVLEEDCIFKKDPRPEVASLLLAEYDAAMFGTTLHWINGEPMSLAGLPGWFHCDNMQVAGAHCVLYSAKGRVAVRDAFLEPQEVHCDIKLSLMAAYGRITLVAQVNAQAPTVVHMTDPKQSTIGHTAVVNIMNMNMTGDSSTGTICDSRTGMVVAIVVLSIALFLGSMVLIWGRVRRANQ
jgi:hypothetical protein